MLTRIEISGFKTFDNFGLDLRPLTAIVGPNASGVSRIYLTHFGFCPANANVVPAMQDLRGKPEELRQSPAGDSECISFAIEVLLSRKGVDFRNKAYPITRCCLAHLVASQRP